MRDEQQIKDHLDAPWRDKSPLFERLEDETARTREWAEGDDYQVPPGVLSQTHVPYEMRNQGLDETYREMLDYPKTSVVTEPPPPPGWLARLRKWLGW